ncbi:surface protease GP63 [Trypanosoma conorhini]|uniref:Leishmanolysin-like peptidase n=1 Tax=Trypanosoma conorhini TaxID=83891 RepID=A0A3R7S502_9TRYP|nr:surface protease GP63 [Trypanosoma conorhini]RNF21504.1 surface protease GP63 [Trypanosoma conorhini]
MAPTVGAGYYTALTLALFADLGYYRANWSMAEPMGWGKGAGCEFLDKKCTAIKDLAAKYPHMFCDGKDAATLRCSSDRRHLGRCTKGIVDVEGSVHFKDVCPVVSTYFHDSTSGTTSNACADASVKDLPGSLTGSGSWCLDAEALKVKTKADAKLAGVCAQVLCEGGAVKVKYSGSDAYVACPEKGVIDVKSSDFEDGGKIKCPRYEEVCTIAANGSSLVIPHVEEEEEIPPAAPEQSPPEQSPPEQLPPEQLPPEQLPPEQLPPEQSPPEQSQPVGNDVSSAVDFSHFVLFAVVTAAAAAMLPP